jgi:hypothetical protein
MTTFADGLYQYGGQPVGNMPDGSGTTYFVDNNSGNDGNTGRSWEKAFKTLSRAQAVSDVDIARGSDRWARRNTIYFTGDRLVENLTAFPSKCDVIGVGSTDAFKQGTLQGNHTIAAGSGCRFFNVAFEPYTAADIMTLTSGAVGIEFHGCEFRATSSTVTAVSAIDSTASYGLKVIGNLFHGAFSGDVIDIGAGDVRFTEIRNNRIMGGANDGIVVTDTTTIATGYLALIADNEIYVNNVTISDGADSTFAVIGNKCVTAAAYGATSHVITVAFAAGNIVTANGATYPIPVWTDIEA